MRIQVNTDSSVEGGDALTLAIETMIHGALDRYGDRLTRIEVHLGDDDGPDRGPHRAKRCLLEARPSGMEPVAVTGSADTVEQACHDATEKMQSLLDSTFGRIDSRDADATIRQNEP